MKYPQLVSTRAVNAISDWLVSRLEQLGVDAPQIYSRLLLSLLQSSVQINDPIEFSNLEAFFAHRKGSYRRYHPFDTNTIKKINAVQCLSDIVSSEQEIASIETLVDELFEKLIDIEKKSTDIENDEQILLATLSVATTSLKSEVNQTNNCDLSDKHHRGIGEISLHSGNGSINNFTATTAKVGENVECKSKRIIENETDPKKQYFRAFPALTKEMEDSFRILRRNAKSLTWPVDKYKISTLAISNVETNITQSLNSNFNKGNEERQTECGSGGDILTGQQLQFENVHGGINSNNILTATGVKRKTKRRRNQALSKGKTIQNIRKNSCSGLGSSNRYRSSSPFWDTDFEGCWEMGRDLIKEFIVKQNNRNRSTSESAAYTKMDQLNQLEDHEMLQLQQEPLNKHYTTSDSNNTKQISPLNPPPIDISFCYTEPSPHPPLNSENDDDTFASISEITNASLNSARPLYKRDMRDSSLEILPAEERNDEQIDFAQFKAKFDSNLEALWNNVDTNSNGAEEKENKGDSSVYSMSSSIMQLSSLPNVAPFKENLKNFWTNYYNHHFDLNKISSKTQETASVPIKNDEMSFGFSSSAFVRDTTYTSDYCSMPSNLEELDKSSNSFKVRRNGDCCGGIETPINVFLQNSIWSKNPTVDVGDSDESFYKKVWNSTQKAKQQVESLSKNTDSISNDSSFHLPQYCKSKWSEGINFGPNASMPLQSQHSQLNVQVSGASSSSSTTISSCSTEQVGKHSNDMGNFFNIERHHGSLGGHIHNSGVIGIDSTDSSTTSTSTTSCSSYQQSNAYNWQTPLLGQSLQPDIQSWSTSNPISLTEMYESDSKVQQQFDGKHVKGKFFVPPIAANEINTVGPFVTLKNHSSTASGFIEYSRIKSSIKVIKHQEQNMPQNPLQQQENYSARKEQQQQLYAEDENLLTSESTHFNPIKTYADGHSFDICGNLDIVEFERSESGYLYLDKERYLEYTRNDAFLAEDDGATATNLHVQQYGGIPLYASSNCDAANYLENAIEQQCNFVIKFRLQSSEVACQTDDEPTNKNVFKSNELHATSSLISQQHPLCLIFSSSLQGMKLQTTGLACNDAIEALNKAVAAAAKAAASSRNPNDSHWLPNAVTNYRNSALWQTKKINSGEIDEVDFQAVNAGDSNCCSLSTLEQWSMHEIGKKCELQGHDNNPEAHSLWGLCVACNNEFKSIPANRLLKNELQLEADEIMSDLKYMQDLYISEGVAAGDSDSDWDIGESVNNSCMVTGSKKLADNDKNESTCNSYDDENMKESLHTEMNRYQQHQSAQEVLHKVNRLIADLLSRENSKPFANALNSTCSSGETTVKEKAEFTSLTSPQSSQFIGSLWSGNDEHNIWQQSQINATFKPLDFFKELNDEHQKTTIISTEDDSLQSHLSWEHDNLAEIWEKRTPSPLTPNSPSVETVENFNANEMNVNIEEFPKKNDAEIKELDSLNVMSPKCITTLIAGFETRSDGAAHSLENHEQIKPNAAYKRTQEFLTANVASISTAPKLKMYNRKRRHSASQNLFHITPTSTTITNHITNDNKFNNNNNNKIADLNQFNVANSNPFKTDIDTQKLIKSNSTENDYGYEDDDLYICGVSETSMDKTNLTQPKQTIITCKYWTTIDPLTCSPIANTEDIVQGATTTFSCLLDKNTSILKHVTMVTRPLTR